MCSLSFRFLSKNTKEKFAVTQEKNGCLWVLGASVLWCLVWCVVLFVPSGRSQTYDNKHADFSGTYIFLKSNCSGHFERGNPFVATTMILNDSEVVIQQESDRMMTIVYHWANGVIQTKKLVFQPKTFNWNQGCLYYVADSYPTAGLAIFPGIARKSRTSVMSKDSEGNLIISSTFEEKGLMLFVIPFKDHIEYTIVLKKQTS